MGFDLFNAADTEGLRYVQPPPVTAFVIGLSRATAYMNMGLFVLNMLPAFPLDGGRMLYLTLAERWGWRRASRIVGTLGLACAAIGVFYALATTLAGFPAVALLRFRPNWQAIRNPGIVPV